MKNETLSPYSMASLSIIPGSTYKHYKELRYKVLALARHSETLEELVVYQALYGQGEVWVRSVAMFLENVSIEGRLLSRFMLVQE